MFLFLYLPPARQLTKLRLGELKGKGEIFGLQIILDRGAECDKGLVLGSAPNGETTVREVCEGEQPTLVLCCT